MSDPITIFDRATVRRHRDRAAPLLDDSGFLFREVADRLADRLDDMVRDFPVALDLGARDGMLRPLLLGRRGIETLIHADLSTAMIDRASGPRLVCDEEFLPIAPASLDLVVSNLSLHWVNDLPGTLIQLRHALKPDGLLLASMFGGETLKELRQSLTEAEVEVEGGLSPRVSPFTDVRDAGMLLQRAGFALPVIDADVITVSYDSPLKLMADLRAMGESNAVAERRKGFTRRTTLLTAAQKYMETHAGPDGRAPATFQVIWIAAWAPSADQPKALKPGSAAHSLAEALKDAQEPPGPKTPGFDEDAGTH